MKANASMIFAAGLVALTAGCTYNKTYVQPGAQTPPPNAPQTVVVATGTSTEPVVVPVAPPAPQTEVIPVSPGDEYVWTSGYWRWSGGQWVWTPGSYVARPNRNASWVAGHWEKKHGGYVWVDGYWK